MDTSQIRFDRLLTNVSVKYQNDDYVASRVFPAVRVTLQGDKYLKAGKHNLRAVDDRRGPNTKANEINWELSADSYYCDGHALRFPIPDEWRPNQVPGLDLNVDTTEQLTDMIGLNEEVNLFNTITGGMTAVDLTAAKWDNDANDPIVRIDQEKETIAKKIGRRPNVLLVSRPVFRGIRNNGKVVGRITGATQLKSATVSAQQLADALELDEVIVAGAINITSREGAATEVSDFIWGKYALLFYRTPNPGPRTISLGYEFAWNIGINGRAVKVIRDEQRSTDIIEASDYYDMKLVVPEAGTLFSNVVS